MENFRLYQRIVTSHEKVVILLDVATFVAQTLDLDALMGADWDGVWIWNE